MSRSRLIALGLAQPKQRWSNVSVGVTLTDWLAAHPAAESHYPEKRKAWSAKYREKNREKLRAYQKRWRANKKRSVAMKQQNADALRG